MNNPNEEIQEVYETLKKLGLPVKFNNDGEIVFDVTGWNIEITEG